jgi:hypothetical protein
MSAITETGREMVCILAFSARPRGLDDQPIPGARRRFNVGEHVRYITFFYTATPEDNPVGFMAVFQPLDKTDKNRYAATQDYFVTIDCWEGLRQHFAMTGAAETDKAGEITKNPIATPAKKSARPAAKVSSTALSAQKIGRDKGIPKHT